jgi:hypothetical protein
MLKIYSLKRTHYVSPNNSLSSATVSPAALSFCSVVRIGAGSRGGAGSGVLPASSHAVYSAKSRLPGSWG